MIDVEALKVDFDDESIILMKRYFEMENPNVSFLLKLFKDQSSS
jgi:hypothetical protein